MPTTDPKVAQAFKLCVGLFKQKTTNGTAYGKLPDAAYAAKTWDTTSIIPVEYQFTNIGRAGSTIETSESAFITDLSKYTKYSSGKITPGVITLASITKADAQTIINSLAAETDLDDPYFTLFMVGALNSGSESTSCTYDVIFASAGVITEDGSWSAEARADFTGNLSFQPSGRPCEGIDACGATLTRTTGGVVTFAVNQ